MIQNSWGVMTFAIGHDVATEFAMAVYDVKAVLDKRSYPPVPPRQVNIYTKYNCN